MGTTANSTTQYTIVDYQSAIKVGGTEGTTDFGFRCRISSTVLTLEINETTNTAPDAELITATGLYARTGGGKNRFGITTRAVTIKRLVGTTPLQFYLKRTIPWLQNNLDATIGEDEPPTISYQGQTDWILVGVREEKVGDG
jgi:hypothetical protein